MKFEDFMVGDVLSCTKWQEQKYLVVDIDNITKELRLQNMGSTLDDTFWWGFYKKYRSINIERGPNFANKTPIERKIAHLYKLFEERNKS
jgi:hypothetical protein